MTWSVAVRRLQIRFCFKPARPGFTSAAFKPLQTYDSNIENSISFQTCKFALSGSYTATTSVSSVRWISPHLGHILMLFKGGVGTGRQLCPTAPGGSDWQRVSRFVRRLIFDPKLLCYPLKAWATHRGIQKGSWSRLWYEGEITTVAFVEGVNKTKIKLEYLHSHFCASS